MSESRFLQSLPADVRDAITPDLEQVELVHGDFLLEAGQVQDFVYFPIDSLISLVVALENGSTVEATIIGNDGCLGISPFLGRKRADLTAIVQMEGTAFRMPVDAFRTQLENAAFRERLGTFTGRTLATVAQSAACIAFHPVQERLARWLLLVCDATEREEFPMTQDFLAVMLGVHRPTVTIAVRLLETSGLIEHRRGFIRIVDGEALTQAACECYRLSGWERPGG